MQNEMLQDNNNDMNKSLLGGLDNDGMGMMPPAMNIDTSLMDLEGNMQQNDDEIDGAH